MKQVHIGKREYDYELTGKVIHIGLAQQGKIISIKWHEK